MAFAMTVLAIFLLPALALGILAVSEIRAGLRR